MLEILAIVLLAGLATGHNWIDRKNCVDMRGYRGMYVPCPREYVAVGLCSSGDWAHCHMHAYTILQCCRVMGMQERKHCLDQQGHYGYHLTCHNKQVVTNMCTSGRTAHCRDQSVTRMICCDGHGLNVDRGNCEWRRETKGIPISCRHNQVMVGACASRTSGECGNGSFTGIYCCEVKRWSGDFQSLSLNEAAKNHEQIEGLDKNNSILHKISHHKQ